MIRQNAISKLEAIMMSLVMIISFVSGIPTPKVVAYDFLAYGIDVSANQGTIDWSKVKSAGISFAIIRSGFGKYAFQEDTNFKSNYANAQGVGIECGTYWVSYAMSKSEAYTEADVCYSVIKGYTFDYPVFYDMEVASQLTSLSKQQITEIALAFCERISSYGYTVGVYANLNWFTNYIDKNQIISNGYEIWIAQYPVKGGTVNPTNYDKSSMCNMWQYSENGHVDGVSGYVDLDVSYKDYGGTSKPLPCKIELSGFQNPQEGYVHTPGANCGLYGTITSNHALKRVWGGVYKLDGTPASGSSTTCSDTTSSTSYSLRGTFNNTIVFDDIPVGSYYFSISAEDNDGYEKELIHNNFFVGSPPVKPSKSVLTANTYEITTGGSITFTASSDTATSYTIGIDKNGTRIKTENMPNGKLTVTFNEAGNYSAYVTSYNSAGYCDSSPIKFTVNNPTVTVKLDGNGGSVSSTSIAVQTNGTYSGLPTTGSKTGYTFKGWYSDPSGGTKVGNGSTILQNAEHTLYVHWIPNTYKVNLVYNDGTEKTETVNATYDNNYNIPDATRTGYHFNGWFTAADGGSQIAASDIVKTTSDLTLYAHWSKDTMMITFNANGGISETGTKLVKYDTKYGILPNAERIGYTFEGWYLDESCTNQITEDSIVQITVNQNVYAKWSLRKYTITFDGNGGIVETNSKQVTFGKSYGVLPSAQRDDDNFVGWFTADGLEITSGSIVEIEEDTILYARWQVDGDVNLDGTFDVNDIVFLQDYLLCRVTFSIENFYAADVLEDGCIDVFDLCLLKRALLNNGED